MSNWFFKLERKYGHKAIPNLSMILIMTYAAGYLIRYLFPTVMGYLVLNPYLVLHGQVWRLVSWLLIPPSDQNIFFILIMLYFYYSIGRSLEQVWGDFKYNVYIFSGILFTIIGAFVIYGIAWLQFGSLVQDGTVTAQELFTAGALMKQGVVEHVLPGTWFYSISTYYVSMSIFMAYAMTFPEMRILLMFIIPIRVKVLGYIYAAFLGLSILQNIVAGQYYMAVVIVASLLNALIFFLIMRNNLKSVSDFKRRADYKRKVTWAKNNTGHETTHNGKTVITRHKCAICGKTELDGELEFRFCSKCDGNYEYCSEHLYTHEHVKRV